VIKRAPVRGAEPGLPVPFGGTLMGRFGVAHPPGCRFVLTSLIRVKALSQDAPCQTT